MRGLNPIKFISGLLLGFLALLALPLPLLAAGAELQSSFTPSLVIRHLSATGSTSTATVTWETNGDSTSQIYYDTGFHESLTEYASSTAEDPTSVSHHSVQLTGLLPSTVYHIRAVSRITLGDIHFTAVSSDSIISTARRTGGGGGSFAPAVIPPAGPPPTESAPQVPAQPPAEDRTIQLVVPNAVGTSGITGEGIVTGTLEATAPDRSFSLSISEGTLLTLSNANRSDSVDLSQIGDTIPARIVVTNPSRETIPPVPDGWVPVSQAYDVNAVTNGYVTGLEMSQAASLVIRYNQDLLPQYIEDLKVFYYNYETGWTQLKPPSGYIAEGPDAAAEVDHFSLFIVLAKVGRSQPPPNIIINRLTLDPPKIQLGQSSDIRVLVTNKGGTPGESVVVVRVAGKVKKTQSVQLDAGESTEIGLIVIPDASGIYKVQAGNASKDLTVMPWIAPDVAGTIYWWLYGLIIGIPLLIFTLLYLRRRHNHPPIEPLQSPDQERFTGLF